jgi:hypothetical protein
MDIAPLLPLLLFNQQEITDVSLSVLARETDIKMINSGCQA